MPENLTPEQRKAVSKLIQRHMLASFALFVKYLFFILLSAFLTVAVNVYYVQSESFVFPVALVNFIFIMHFMLKETLAKRVEFSKNVKKILFPDQEVK